MEDLQNPRYNIYITRTHPITDEELLIGESPLLDMIALQLDAVGQIKVIPTSPEEQKIAKEYGAGFLIEMYEKPNQEITETDISEVLKPLLDGTGINYAVIDLTEEL